MTNTIVIDPIAPAVASSRRGNGFGVASLVLALFAAFWSLILWAIGMGAAQAGSGYGVALVVYAICAFVGLVFFAVALVLSALALVRNAYLGVVCGTVGMLVACAALAGGVLVAVSLV